MPVCKRCYEITDEPCRNDTETLYCPRLTRQPKKKELTMTTNDTLTAEQKVEKLKEAFRTLWEEATDQYVRSTALEAMNLCDMEPASAARVYDVMVSLGGVK
jgi:N12 class adenine-specific DNA methylase